MFRKTLLPLLAILSMFAQDQCVKSKQLWIRHTEPKGVGFREGYTTLEAFLMSSEEMGGFYPYLDARGHLFNNMKGAANLGVGGRWWNRDRIWGANFYYDVRNSTKATYNQLSLGLETIGTICDFYLNGYLNVGRKNSHLLKSEFDHFSGHFLYVRNLFDSAMSGFDANLRTHFLKNAKWDAYFDVGPYYYRDSCGKSLWGGKAGVSAIMADYFFAEATASYDHMFKWIGQGIAGIRLPLGRKPVVHCPSNAVLASRLMQIPDHNEIIVVNRNHEIELAKDSNGNLLFFLFVNNLSHSDGTFESPFPFLVEAEAASNPGDIIYVFQGDGTTTNMDMGITLKDNQQLLGSGISHTVSTQFGPITIPNLTTGYPTITNLMGRGIILANSNVVSGMHVNGAIQYGIYGGGIANGLLDRNRITDIVDGQNNPSGIYLTGPSLSGTFSITQNFITGFDAMNGNNMHGIYLAPTDNDVVSFDVTGNYIDTFRDGMEIQFYEHSRVRAIITENYFHARGYNGSHDNGLYLAGQSSTTPYPQLNFTAKNNEFVGSACGMSTLPHDHALIEGIVTQNRFIDSPTGYLMDGGGSGLSIIEVTKNEFANNSIEDFRAQSGDSATVCIKLLSNDAPDFGYNMNRKMASAALNLIKSFDNVGDVHNINMAEPYTTDPTCP